MKGNNKHCEKNKNNFLVRLTNTTFWYIIYSEGENNKYCPLNVEHCMGQFYFINKGKILTINILPIKSNEEK